MTRLSDEETARRFIHAWSASHSHVIDGLAAEDLVVSYPHFPEPLRGRKAFTAMLNRTHQYFPDLSVAVESVVAQANTAAVEWAYHGTHEAGELFGVSVIGRDVEVAGMTMYDVEIGLVTRERGVVDNLGSMQQLGALENPSGS